MSDAFGLSKQRLEELRYVWNEIRRLRRIQQDTLNVSQFLLVLKSLGIRVTRQDQWILQQEFAARGAFTFEDLVHVGATCWTEEVLEESLVSALKMLDPLETGYVSVDDIRCHLYKLGITIRLTLPEIDAFLGQFEEAPTGRLPIDKLVRRILSG